MVEKEEDLKLAEALLDMDCIGVDGEWVPTLHAFEKVQIALLQIGNEKKVFLFDV